jgi:hypothetical protein
MLKMTLVAGVVALSALAGPASATTLAPQSSLPQSVADSSLTQQVHYRYRWHYRHGGYGRCHFWRHECAARWGWAGYRFHRCLWRHGC